MIEVFRPCRCSWRPKSRSLFKNVSTKDRYDVNRVIWRWTFYDILLTSPTWQNSVNPPYGSEIEWVSSGEYPVQDAFRNPDLLIILLRLWVFWKSPSPLTFLSVFVYSYFVASFTLLCLYVSYTLWGSALWTLPRPSRVLPEEIPLPRKGPSPVSWPFLF